MTTPERLFAALADRYRIERELGQGGMARWPQTVRACHGNSSTIPFPLPRKGGFRTGNFLHAVRRGVRSPARPTCSCTHSVAIPRRRYPGCARTGTNAAPCHHPTVASSRLSPRSHGTTKSPCVPIDPSLGKWVIPEGTAIDPVWSRDGRTLYYREGPSLRAARLRTAPTFAVLSRETVLTDPDYYRSCCFPNYDVSPDGKRIIMARRPGPSRVAGFVLVTNRGEEIRNSRRSLLRGR